MAEHASAPFDWQSSGLPGSNGLFNIYVTDKDGRKIAAVWGKPGEKEATANLFVAAPALVTALDKAINYLAVWAATIGDKKASEKALEVLRECTSALAKAKGEDVAEVFQEEGL